MPRDTLTSDQIIKAAVELLDSDGLEGLNMRALGAKLNSAATAMYWHVGSKENLIVLAGDQVWHEIVLPGLSKSGWRKAASHLATELYSMLNRHPWLLQAFSAFPMFGPGKARYDDFSLAVYEAAGFSGAQADQAATAVFTYVMGNALGPSAQSSLARKLSRDADGEKLMAETVTQARAVASEFPRLRARLDTPATAYAASPEFSFEFGLRAILDGLEAQLS